MCIHTLSFFTYLLVAASIKCPVACGASDRVCQWQTRKNFCLKNFFGERHWSSRYRSPIIYYRSPIVTWQTVHRLFTTVHRLPFTDYLLPLTDYHSPTIHYRSPIHYWQSVIEHTMSHAARRFPTAYQLPSLVACWLGELCGLCGECLTVLTFSGTM